MRSNTRSPQKFRRLKDDNRTQRSLRPAPRRQTTRHAQVAAAIREA
jgi:hypothetical protein